MSNSALVDYTKISPNKNSPRKEAITKITIHHMAGNLSVEQCGAVFANAARQASSNYGIGSDGRIGLYVDEADRSWCSGNRDNDERAVTIEVANDDVKTWSVSDKAMASLIGLCADICRRNGIGKLNYTGDKTGNLTMHRFFQATACPGDWLASKFPMIADEVNRLLEAGSAPSFPPYDIPEAGDEAPSDEPSVWAKDAVKWATEKGLVIGDGNGMIRPGECVTREEVCVILERFSKLYS